jgi:hypothetical protein
LPAKEMRDENVELGVIGYSMRTPPSTATVSPVM